VVKYFAGSKFDIFFLKDCNALFIITARTTLASLLIEVWLQAWLLQKQATQVVEVIEPAAYELGWFG